jgi:hypothetical protein
VYTRSRSRISARDLPERWKQSEWGCGLHSGDAAELIASHRIALLFNFAKRAKTAKVIRDILGDDVVSIVMKVALKDFDVTFQGSQQYQCKR